MLDDQNVIAQRDPQGALKIAADQWQQAAFEIKVNEGAHDERPLTHVVVAGMGGSALSAGLVQSWLAKQLGVSFEIVRTYSLPNYVDKNTLVIASSYSGNTEETLSCLAEATEKSAQVGILASGGKMIETATEQSIAHVAVPSGLQPRMSTLYMLRGLIALLIEFGIVAASALDDIAETSKWLQEETANWLPTVSTDKNESKQYALLAVGKTPVFYGGALTAPLAYKWKISWNENAKNTAFWNQYPEFNHNEFMGWASHPVDKPFAIFDLVSPLEHPQILKRFQISDKLLSGKRPKANTINLRGDTLLQQLLWGCILADFTSIYVAILNGVDPTPVDLIEKLKVELVA